MDKLKTILARRNMTPPQFADAIGVHPRTGYKYVSGERTPDRHVMPRIIQWSGGELTWDDFYSPPPAPAETGAAAL